VRLVLFDIDGTLLSTGGAGLVALRMAFDELHDLPDAVEGIEFHGLTDPIILASIFRRHLGREASPDEMERAIDGYLRHLPGCLAEAEGFRVLPGVLPLIEELAAREDVVLGLATGNLEEAANVKLARARLEGHFGPGGFGSDDADRIELTRLAVERGRARTGADSEAIVVGDTVHDVRCAHAVGVPCLAVATGNASPATLREAGADWTVGTLEAPEAREALGLAR